MKLAEEIELREREDPRRATFLELFFDLVYVFLLFQLSGRVVNRLQGARGAADLDTLLAESGKALVLLLALWSVWWAIAWTTSRYNPRRLRVQAIVILAILCGLIMALSLPFPFRERAYALAFALAYVTIQVGRPAILALSIRGERLRLKLRILIYFSATGVLWITGAVIGGWRQLVLWVVALAVEWVANRLGWPIPGLGRSNRYELSIAGEHLGERYQQFFLVVLGESILGAGFAVSAAGYHPARLAAFAVSVVITVLFWRIYFYRAGLILSEAIVHSPHPGRVSQSTADTHFVMISGVFIASIGYQLAIISPTNVAAVGWIIIIVGSMMFMAGRARFEYEVFGRVSRSRLIALFVLFTLLPLGTPLWQLAVAVAVAAVLLGVAVADARRAYGRPSERAKPPL